MQSTTLIMDNLRTETTQATPVVLSYVVDASYRENGSHFISIRKFNFIELIIALTKGKLDDSSLLYIYLNHQHNSTCSIAEYKALLKPKQADFKFLGDLFVILSESPSVDNASQLCKLLNCTQAKLPDAISELICTNEYSVNCNIGQLWQQQHRPEHASWSSLWEQQWEGLGSWQSFVKSLAEQPESHPAARVSNI